jgi:hypothetical protein
MLAANLITALSTTWNLDLFGLCRCCSVDMTEAQSLSMVTGPLIKLHASFKPSSIAYASASAMFSIFLPAQKQN